MYGNQGCYLVQVETLQHRRLADARVDGTGAGLAGAAPAESSLQVLLRQDK